MEFAKETVLGVADEIVPLLQAHYRETCRHRDVMYLSPDWPRYVSLEESGACHVFTARVDGVLVGYAAFFVAPHPHYIETVVASNDVMFIDKEHRRGSNALRFIDYCEQELKKVGANMVTWHIKYSLDWSPIMYRKGYEDEEKVVGKFI